MRGTGESTAAITIVNALPAGVGSAIGIDLRARANVELHPAGSRGKWDVEIPEPSRTPLVIAALTEALQRCAPDSSGTGALALESEIPVAQGLKSSSAVSSAVVLAVARATGVRLSTLEVARLSAEVARAAGVSATGALDDAVAGLSGGFVVTDNRAGTVLASFPAPTDLGVALFVPPGSHRPSPELVPAFRAEESCARAAAELALSGDWPAAMRQNTELVERVIGYDYGSLRSRVARRGAVASGVSGLGPAFAAVAPRAQVDAILREFPGSSGLRQVRSFSTAPRFEDLA
jgi:shikimate kinase